MSISAPRWLPWTALVVIVAGLAASTYLTITHYTTSVTLACPETGVINCAKVTTSSYSVIAGIPLPLLGLFFFVVLLPLNLPGAWRSGNKWLRWGRLAFTATGLPSIIYLIYIELFKLNAICLYCSVVHALTFVLFALTAYGTAATAELPPETD